MANIAIVIGAGSAIGTSVVQKNCSDHSIDQVIAISRAASPIQTTNSNKLSIVASDYSEQSIAELCEAFAENNATIVQVIICNGILHSDDVKPEKRLENVSAAALSEVFHSNTIVPLLWLAKLAPLLKSKQICRIAVLSARVGSISDNRSGGWYAYRASKAALNMAIKTAAIEFRRRAPNVKLIAFHPGTVDTQLSKPFHGSVPEGKLFTADFTATALLGLLNTLDPNTETEFFDWSGKPVSW